MLLAGPILNEAGEPRGSLLIIRAETLDAARAFAENDPYAQADLFKNVDIKPYRLVAGALAPKTS